MKDMFDSAATITDKELVWHCQFGDILWKACTMTKTSGTRTLKRERTSLLHSLRYNECPNTVAQNTSVFSSEIGEENFFDEDDFFNPSLTRWRADNNGNSQNPPILRIMRTVFSPTKKTISSMMICPKHASTS